MWLGFRKYNMPRLKDTLEKKKKKKIKSQIQNEIHWVISEAT